ncbi:hypothetical protein FA15DRAFT_761248 [Coprinopsis marcescibilis]|uniref:Uncharacterized protein n=1 Tax=Coprinopsis marcescibilis TaxID=230819 RepID=A0A5C3KA85_COPMA|nr:hypothetical protein FA15DRAFT_761248 [Coprinopsis marcescibilis]
MASATHTGTDLVSLPNHKSLETSAEYHKSTHGDAGQQPNHNPGALERPNTFMLFDFLNSTNMSTQGPHSTLNSPPTTQRSPQSTMSPAANTVAHIERSSHYHNHDYHDSRTYPHIFQPSFYGGVLDSPLVVRDAGLKANLPISPPPTEPTSTLRLPSIGHELNSTHSRVPHEQPSPLLPMTNIPPSTFSTRSLSTSPTEMSHSSAPSSPSDSSLLSPLSPEWGTDYIEDAPHQQIFIASPRDRQGSLDSISLDDDFGSNFPGFLPCLSSSSSSSSSTGPRPILSLLDIPSSTFLSSLESDLYVPSATSSLWMAEDSAEMDQPPELDPQNGNFDLMSPPSSGVPDTPASVSKALPMDLGDVEGGGFYQTYDDIPRLFFDTTSDTTPKDDHVDYSLLSSPRSTGLLLLLDEDPNDNIPQPRSPSPDNFSLDTTVISELPECDEVQKLADLRKRAQATEKAAKLREAEAIAEIERIAKSGGALDSETPVPFTPVGQSATLGDKDSSPPRRPPTPTSPKTTLELQRVAAESKRLAKRERGKVKEISALLRLKLGERGVTVDPTSLSMSASKHSTAPSPTTVSPPRPLTTQLITSPPMFKDSKSLKRRATSSSVSNLVAKMILSRNEASSTSSSSHRSSSPSRFRPLWLRTLSPNPKDNAFAYLPYQQRYKFLRSSPLARTSVSAGSLSASTSRSGSLESQLESEGGSESSWRSLSPSSFGFGSERGMESELDELELDDLGLGEDEDMGFEALKTPLIFGNGLDLADSPRERELLLPAL